MIHIVKNTIIIKGKVYELTKHEGADVCEGCALLGLCEKSTSIYGFCTEIHGVNTADMAKPRYHYEQISRL